MYLGVRAIAGYKFIARCSPLSSFIFLKYIYSWLIICYCIRCNKFELVEASRSTELVYRILVSL